VSERTIGLLHPGEMGAAVGHCLRDRGHVVLWASAGRGSATAARAAAAGLIDAGTVTEIASRSDVIVSVCPPHAALDTARQVAGAGFGGLYVDANAISPATAGEVAGIVAGGGAGYVDGGIIGTPPVAPGFIRLYLSGPRAGEVRELFGNTVVDTRVVDQGGQDGVAQDGMAQDGVTRDGVTRDGVTRDGVTRYGAGGVGAASAVKMAYASFTKGSGALLLAARALARAQGVEEVLLAEWGISQPGLGERSARAAGSAASKGWRWVAEMEEIAASMAAAGLPAGFHQAAAEIYRRSPHADGTAGDGEANLDTILNALTERGGVPLTERGGVPAQGKDGA
jgi:3-hydroxyisobutyrate dehydrogenase-like beta-hydroxyacid dehydrogenase